MSKEALLVFSHLCCFGRLTARESLRDLSEDPVSIHLSQMPSEEYANAASQSNMSPKSEVSPIAMSDVLHLIQRAFSAADERYPRLSHKRPDDP